MKFLITGLGSIGQRHVRNLRFLLGEDADISAYRVKGRDIVIDTPQAIAGQLPEVHYGLRTFSSMAEALADKPDVVFITNPIAFHVETAIAAVRHGAHVFIEKPVSDRLAGVDELLQIVREKNLVAGVGYQLRFHPALRLVRQALLENRIGPVCSVHIHFGEYLPGMHPYEDYRESHAARRAEGGGAILCLSHEIDYAYWLFGMPKRVFAVGGHLSGMELDVEDTASLLFEYHMNERTVPVHIHVDFIQRPPARTCKIVGETGTIVWDYYKGSFALYDTKKAKWSEKVFEQFERNTMFIDELSDFLASLNGARPGFATLQEGIAVLRIALTARRALEERRVVELVE